MVLFRCFAKGRSGCRRCPKLSKVSQLVAFLLQLFFPLAVQARNYDTTSGRVDICEHDTIIEMASNRRTPSSATRAFRRVSTFQQTFSNYSLYVFFEIPFLISSYHALQSSRIICTHSCTSKCMVEIFYTSLN